MCLWTFFSNKSGFLDTFDVFMDIFFSGIVFLGSPQKNSRTKFLAILLLKKKINT